MLVLSRKEGERLVIGDSIVVTVNRISGNRITLGVEAPREVRIVRGELQERSTKTDAERTEDPAPKQKDYTLAG
ncbi:MAG: carbon storage regulator [Planctomycetota bacterium]